MTYDGRCFGCGQDNPDGLRLQFLQVGQEVVAECSLDSRFQSWQGVVHGGMVALLLDEAVGWACWHAGHPAVTAKLEVRLRRPLAPGQRVRVLGRVDEVRRSLVRASARVEDAAGGGVLAEATSSLVQTPTAIRS